MRTTYKQGGTMDEKLEEKVLKSFEYAQGGQYKKAVDFIDDIKEHPDLDREDPNVTRMFNNYLICCIHAKEYEKGSEFADTLQDIAHLNPHIYHNSACLYCYTNQLEKAVEQVQLARIYGGMELIDLLKGDEDLSPIFKHPGFIKAIEPRERKADAIFTIIPEDGMENPLFKEISTDNVISIFFTYKEDFTDPLFEKIKEVVDEWFERTDWKALGAVEDELIMHPATFYRGFEIHIRGIHSPEETLIDLIKSVKNVSEDLIQILVILREWDDENEVPGISINSDQLPEFSYPENQEEFWENSFDESKPPPYPEDIEGMYSYMVTEEGGYVSELRGSIIHFPNLRIGYGLVDIDYLDYDETSGKASEVLQEKLAKYFYDEVPAVFNREPEMDGPLDRIEYNGRKGLAFAIKRDDVVEYYGYGYRYKEYEIFLALRELIEEMGLSSVIHWDRGDVYIFNLWEE
jgi:hypothetical protein